jgi:PBP1b-binding outer membrane lipoprotein LpoB
MKLNPFASNAALIGLIFASSLVLQACTSELKTSESPTPSPSTEAKPSQEVTVVQAMKDITSMTPEQHIEMITKNKGQFGSADAMRRFFFGDLEPIGIQPGGAGMVVNLYNKKNNVTFSYCSTFDVVVAVKKDKVEKFSPEEVK